MGEAQVISFPNDDALAAAVADAWLGAIGEAEAAGRKFLVALSGGRVTKKLFGQVVARSQQQGVSFANVEFFWADERCIPPDDEESNFRLANECLFGPLQTKPESIHRIRGELAQSAAVKAALDELVRVGGAEPGAMPVLDLILLGMGEDGHVASLFPRNAMTSRDRTSVYLAVENSPKPPPKRVTLGNGPIYAARSVWVLASGSGKEGALRESLSPSGHTPLAQVIKNRAATKIFTDIPHSWASRIRLDGFRRDS